ncbi:MAG: hypothetical protein P4L10_12340 [Acidobacteriaceae bacterium]|nr:hypothetical protein [Acidobacteriaceae bacterium]
MAENLQKKGRHRAVEQRTEFCPKMCVVAEARTEALQKLDAIERWRVTANEGEFRVLRREQGLNGDSVKVGAAKEVAAVAADEFATAFLQAGRAGWAVH